MKKIEVNYIRVDDKKGIFLLDDPGTVDIHSDGKVKDIILEVQKDNIGLQAIPVDNFKVYRLKTPIAIFPVQTSEGPGASTKSEDSKKEKATGTETTQSKGLDPLEDLKNQIEMHGVTHCHDYLELLPKVQDVSVFEKCPKKHITAIVYHPWLAGDCEYSGLSAQSSSLVMRQV